jgi:CRP/FNR family transcriptional regulator, anaerobic regulatory protein
VAGMIKTLEQAVEKVRKLSKERQEYAAAVLEKIAEARDEVCIASDSERRLVREASLQPPAACDTCPILKDSLCLPLPAKQRDGLRRMARARFVPQGHLIFREGDEVTSFASIMTGVVKLFKTAPGKAEQIVTFMHPPALLGYAFNNVHLYSAEAATDVNLCMYPQAPFRSLLGKSRTLSRRIFEVTDQQLESARECMVMLGRKSAYQKVAGLLAMFAQRAQPDSSRALQFLLPVSRSDLADYLGLTIETVSRNITILRQKGFIELKSAREVVVPDIESLLAEAGMQS